MKIINLTPHAVTVAGITIEPSGIVARVSATTADAGSVDFNGTSIPLTTTVYGEVQGLPDQRDDTLLIVSSMVAARCKDRTDVFIPNEPIRDAEGRIIGCKSLGRVWPHHPIGSICLLNDTGTKKMLRVCLGQRQRECGFHYQATFHSSIWVDCNNEVYLKSQDVGDGTSYTRTLVVEGSCISQ